jgi:hypothetical protein
MYKRSQESRERENLKYLKRDSLGDGGCAAAHTHTHCTCLSQCSADCVGWPGRPCAMYIPPRSPAFIFCLSALLPMCVHYIKKKRSGVDEDLWPSPGDAFCGRHKLYGGGIFVDNLIWIYYIWLTLGPRVWASVCLSIHNHSNPHELHFCIL